MQIPNQVHGFSVYIGASGSKLIGIGTVTLSTVNFVVDELKGSGIAGSVELIVAGYLQKMGMAIDFHATTSDYLSLLAPTTQQIVCRAGIQYQDDQSYGLLDIPQRVIAQVYPKGINLGKLDSGTKPGTILDLSVVALSIYFNNTKYIELDPQHLVCYVAGTDYLSNLRSML